MKIMLCALVLMLSVVGCKYFPDKPHIPDIPIPPAVTNLPPIIPPVTNTPPASEWGKQLTAPAEDLRPVQPDGSTGETECNRAGINLRLLVVKPDKFIGDWAKKGISGTANADGTVTLTMAVMQGPSGAWYKPAEWRPKTDNQKGIPGDSITLKRGDFGEWTRARWECREKLK